MRCACGRRRHVRPRAGDERVKRYAVQLGECDQLLEAWRVPLLESPNRRLMDTELLCNLFLRQSLEPPQTDQASPERFPLAPTHKTSHLLAVMRAMHTTTDLQRV